MRTLGIALAVITIAGCGGSSNSPGGGDPDGAKAGDLATRGDGATGSGGDDLAGQGSSDLAGSNLDAPATSGDDASAAAGDLATASAADLAGMAADDLAGTDIAGVVPPVEMGAPPADDLSAAAAGDLSAAAGSDLSVAVGGDLATAPKVDLSVVPPGCGNRAKDGNETDVDCGGGTCGPCATGGFCFRARDCQSGFCTNNACDPPSCTDAVKNGTETDVDCGGATCARCAIGAGCLRGSDCQSATCSNNLCATPPCQDGRLDGNETDTDCGGGTCAQCRINQGCLRGSDCLSGLCTNNLCVQPPTCGDQAKNGKETDIDCGGGCPGCGANQACLAGTDCLSGTCSNLRCTVAPSCVDKLKNGAETDVDCGGGTCAKCAVGKACSGGADCLSALCANGLCAQGPSCTDGKRDGNETGLDCGGPTCPLCPAGQGCLAPDDCTSGVCTTNLCQPAPASCTDGIHNGNETGLDCGGGTCKPCPAGQGCLAARDCASGTCTNNLCQASANPCQNGVQDGTESDVDCGGSTCPRCGADGMCLFDTDCLSLHCNSFFPGFPGTCDPSPNDGGVAQDLATPPAPDLSILPPDLSGVDLAGQSLPKCPNILFVVDRSGSMSADVNGGNGTPTKWQLAQTAVETEVTRYGANVPFGLEMYTSSAFDDVGCYNDTAIDVEPAPGNAAKINQVIGAAMPDGATNTGEAIRRAASDPILHDPNRADYLILITDGDPNCNSGDMPGTATYTISQINLAAAQSPTLHTFVVGFDGMGGANPANLDAMAIAGREPVSPCDGTAGSPCYYSGYSNAKFQASIDYIVNQLVHGNGAYAACAP